MHLSAGGFDSGKLIEYFSNDSYHHSDDFQWGEKEYMFETRGNVIK